MKLILVSFGLLGSSVALAQTTTQSLTIHQSVFAHSRSTQQAGRLLLADNHIESQAHATYVAGQSITLQAGFEAQAGSVFEALIGERTSTLQARLLGNPVVGHSAQIEIMGVAGQAVSLRLVDLQGRLVHEQRIEQANEIEQVSLPLGSSRGTLLLKASTDTQQQTLKLLRP